MKKSALIKLPALLIAVFLLASTLLLPSYVFAQGRGHGRGQSKKSAKFINGHDARDGRWDGRGPRPGSLIIRHRRRHRPRIFFGNRIYRGHGRHRGWIRRR